MKNTSSLDTNILLRAILNDVPRQSARVEELLSDSSHTFLLDDIAVSESVYVLESFYRQPREEIVDELNVFLASSNISCSRSLFAQIFPLYLKHPKLSFNDIYLSVKSEQSSAEPLWTFDKKLATQLPSPKLLA